ncbi:MAG TPA: hypothetical protein QGF58_17735 [Myxococcota bacterium]|nr:hypothetical protein [Myxococcota bacterium]
MFSLLLTLACGPEEQPDCSELQELERDACRAGEIARLGAEDSARLLELTAGIEDPVVRGAAVDGWMREHGQAIARERGMEICEVLDRHARRMCIQRIDAAHLNR